MVGKLRKLFGISIFILIATCLIVCNVYAQGAQEHYLKAQALITSGKYDEAISELTAAIEIDPTVADYFTMRGELYRNKSDVISAISDYSKSIELNPNSAEVYYLRAICYYSTKEYNKAWEDVHKAQNLGYTIFPGFIEDLQKASGQDR
jgi:tetratricopeptide (TPR) repeat protein